MKADHDIPWLALQLTPIQIQIVHRNGDRTLITPLENESFWASLLPTDRSLVADGSKSCRHGDQILGFIWQVERPSTGD